MTNYSGNDIYCDMIIPRKTDIVVVAETENVLAFYHTKPFWKHHIVVVPKWHTASLIEFASGSADLAKEFLDVVARVAGNADREYGAARVGTNLGDYQDSKHFHVHVSAGERATA